MAREADGTIICTENETTFIDRRPGMTYSFDKSRRHASPSPWRSRLPHAEPSVQPGPYKETTVWP
jgi:hypothetical protein